MGQSATERMLRERFRSGVAAEGGAADAARKRVQQFNPGDAVREFATGAFDTFQHDLARNLEDLRGRQVGMGRLDTGFATEDSDRMIEFGLRDLNNRIAQQALGAANLELGAIGIENQARDRYLELLTGGLDREIAEREARFGVDDFLASAFETAGSIIPFI